MAGSCEDDCLPSENSSFRNWHSNDIYSNNSKVALLGWVFVLMNDQKLWFPAGESRTYTGNHYQIRGPNRFLDAWKQKCIFVFEKTMLIRIGNGVIATAIYYFPYDLYEKSTSNKSFLWVQFNLNGFLISRAVLRFYTIAHLLYNWFWN